MYKTLLLALFLLPTAIFSQSEQPNIIFFLVDDYDKQDCSEYTGPRNLTPSLKRLAKNGITFDKMHMTSTVCTASRYTCLTGRYAGFSYSEKYLNAYPEGYQGGPAFDLGLEDDNMNVAQVLSDNGYVTGLVGKYHVASSYNSIDEPEKNIPYSEEVNDQKFFAEKQTRDLIKGSGFDWAKNVYLGNLKAPFNHHNPEWTISAALEFVEDNKDKPFFLYYGTTLAHGPSKNWDASIDEPLTTGEGIIDSPLGVMDRDSLRERVLEIGLEPEEKSGILWMDDSLGLLMDRLEELGIADNTIICFVADHGSEGKASLHKSGTEVPCIMSWPAGMKAGKRCDALLQNTDFVATWFDVAGIEKPEEYQMHGISFKKLFTRPRKSTRDHVYCEVGPARAIKTKEWNYITLRYTREDLEAVEESDRYAKRLLGLSGGIGRSAKKPEAIAYDQLYNLEQDELEESNLAEDPAQEAIIMDMQSKLLNALQLFPNRPYGEFIPGPNTLAKGEFDIILDAIKKHNK
ncbi:heparan N-sulfatase [Lentisphaera araneosa HTCC2155]|uniref:Heparan N-sulfatase n=1 Tax=Lentisphaera araneosa HTCC2155 TaxID=313628 RepID=A6DSH6_9BACT|nr:sulfatase-like hydrolase/transferase [Lentisphaera araneosa]EDM25421.1 heparan N-sulfatase [Lentisphaera araneosa HTCC2155]